MGIQNSVHRLQNYFVTLEMIEGYSFVSAGFWCKFFSFFVFVLKFLIVFNYFLMIIIFNLIIFLILLV